MARTNDARGPSLKEFAYSQISEWILNDELEPGSALVEMDLAERLGISRTPVREALHRLEQEGLVEMVQRRGGIVTRLSTHDLEELFEVREATEGMAARLASIRGDRSQLESIEKMFESADSKTDQAERLAALEVAGEALHDYVLKACGNRRLQRIADTFRIQIRKERRIAAAIPGRIQQSIAEHRAVLDALKQRDADAAERHMRRHVVSTHDSVMDLHRRSF